MVDQSVIHSWIAKRKQAGLYRRVRVVETAQAPKMTVNGKDYRVFCSNNYLGLANHPRVVAVFTQGAKRYGVGSGAAHLINGHSIAHQQLEEYLAYFLQRDKVMLFSSGYMANIGVLDALTDQHTLVLQDRLNHASLLDGVRLSHASMRRYQHNNMVHLEKLLKRNQRAKKYYQSVFIVSDSVFSMDGDCANLMDLGRLAKQYQAGLLIDDAHGIGVLGDGRGAVLEAGLSQQTIPLVMTTFGKALGVSGACVAGDGDWIDFLMQRARSWIYTTAMPPAMALATLESLKVLGDEPWRITHLRQLISYFKQQITPILTHSQWQLMPSDTAIQPLLVGDEKEALKISNDLFEQRVWVSAIRYPTVRKGQARLRITLSAEHDYSDVDYLIHLISRMIN